MRSFINALLVSFVVILMGCSGNSGGSNTSLATVSFDPGSGGVANGATNVSLSPTIVLKFSVPINPTTVNSSTVFLTTSGGIFPTKKARIAINTNVPISDITSNLNNTVFSFSPISQLAPNTKYFVIISDKVQTPNGNSVVGDKRFSFTTGSSAIPTVSIINPNNGATGVSLSPSIQIRFSETVKNVTTNTVKLRLGSKSGQVITTTSLTAGANNTYTFSPTSQLNEMSAYYVVIENGIVNNSGNSVVPIDFNFTTGDFTNPTVNIITPTNNATNVLLSPNIQIQFSESVQSVTPTTVTLRQGNESGTIVAISSLTGGANNTYTFSPTSPLSEKTTYYVIVTNGITDLNNNPLVPANFSFTTGDFTNPTVNMVSPNNNATGVSVSPNIQIQFSESVLNVTPVTVGLRQGSESGAVVAISSLTLGANNTYTFTPNIPLSELTTYYVVLESGIIDLASNPLSPTSFHFTTGDFTAPTVSIINPNNNAVGISLSPSIQVQFSESVLNVVSPNVKLRQGNSESGTIISIGAITLGANNTYTFSPSSTLSELTNYYVVLESAITDSAGNPLSRTVFNFQTGDFTAPTVNMISPSNNQTGVTANPTIFIQFSESVQNVVSPNITLRQGSPAGTPITISAITESANHTYFFNPTVQLESLTTYYVVLESTITDMVGNPLSPIDFHFTVKGPEWEYVGAAVSDGGGNYVNLAFTSTGTMYVAYADANNANKATVKTLQAGNWVDAGNPWFSGQAAVYLNLAISPTDNAPYVVYQDYSNSGKATVNKLESNTWNIVGGPASPGGAKFTRIVISSTGTPIIGFADESSSPSDKASSRIFNGTTWVDFGTPDFSAGGISDTSMVIDSGGVVFFSFFDSLPTPGIIVGGNLGNWTNIGNGAFAGFVSYTSLARTTAGWASGGLYLALSNGGNGNRLNVMNFNGTSWVTVGAADFSSGSTEFNSLATSPSNKLYVGYRDNGNFNGATVMTYNGSAWVPVGVVNFSNAPVQHISLAIDPTTGIPYIAFTDIIDNKVKVMRYVFTP